jgi:beta-N-acetylhexosaminidase
MLAPLTPQQQQWAESTLDRMSLRQCVGQLLCPQDRDWHPKVLPYRAAQWRELMKDVPLGCVFCYPRQKAELVESLRALQDMSPVPVLVAADIESGLAGFGPQGTEFPSAMAFGAAGSAAWARQMGRRLALQARACGLHWTFSPVVDPNINFQNPVTITRAFGDDPAAVARLSVAKIRGIQAGGAMAATAKHFPGDGMDDRDQHICTTINPLTTPRWMKTYGRIWRAAIEAGVLSVMAGHIALPHWQGKARRPLEALPATLDDRLQVDLLRKELGFEGLVVSDAIQMMGMTSRCRHDELAVRNILAGSDVVLFSEARRDLAALLKAVRRGDLSERRIRQSARRVLELKARLGVHEQPFGPNPSPDELSAARELAEQVARGAITIVRGNGLLPRPLRKGSRVVTATLKYGGDGLTVLDDELRRRGCKVTHLHNPQTNELARQAQTADRVFVNFAIGMHSRIGTIRLTGELIQSLWDLCPADSGNYVFTSFGSPYHLYELPHLPNMMLAYSGCEASQRAAVAAWLGEAPAPGRLPVRLPTV